MLLGRRNRIKDWYNMIIELNKAEFGMTLALARPSTLEWQSNKDEMMWTKFDIQLFDF